MENRRIRMPAGAWIACILIMLLIAALIVGAALWMGDKLPIGRRMNEAIATLPPATESPASESPASEEPTQAPGVTQTARPEPSDTTAPYTTQDPGSAGLTGHQTAKTEMLKTAIETVVSIDITMTNGSEDVYAGSGSGVLISSDGYIVTCNHVVEGAASIFVFLNDGTQFKANLVGCDFVTDIALVKIDITGVEFPYATLGTSGDLLIGEDVFVIGNALGELSNTVTDGIISGLDRDITIDGQSMTLIQTSAAINSGNSGGALFRSDGTLIGIVNAKSSGTTSSGAIIEGLGYAVPIDLAKPILTDIKQYGYVTGRPYLGVSTKTVTYGYTMLESQTYPQVVSIMEGSPAEKAGIQINDVITSVNGQTVATASDLRIRIAEFSIGDEITITVLRGEQTIDLNVKLEERKF